jgi:3-mercaptopyruvate sulfurtransferase SseA
LADLPARIAELKKYQHKTILLNCQRGMRSAKACDILRKAEFTQLNNLHGGLNAWIEAKLPVVTNSKATSAKAANAAAVKKAPAAKSVAKPNVAEVAVETSAESAQEKGVV